MAKENEVPDQQQEKENNSHEYIKVSRDHQDRLLWQVSVGVERIEGALLGTPFNPKGLVHEVADLKEDVSHLLEWKSNVELIQKEEERIKKEKESKQNKSKSSYITIATIIAAIVAVAAFLWNIVINGSIKK